MTKREQVQELVAQKKTTAEIAAILGLPKATVRYHRESSKTRRGAQISEHRRKIKRKAIDYSGGKCLRCGYNKSQAALGFHHLDPNEKKMGLGAGNTWEWETMKAEVDKTILVCANCHREVHDGVWEVDQGMVETQWVIRAAYADKPLICYKD
jgi:predicted HNH restriction endonuclease